MQADRAELCLGDYVSAPRGSSSFTQVEGGEKRELIKNSAEAKKAIFRRIKSHGAEH